MIKKMLVNATHPEENRVAIVEDGILSELDIEVAGKEQTKGNIYKATVIRVEQGLQAAFVDYGAERLGFLQMGEIHPGLFQKGNGEESRGRPRITDVLHRGQELLVQVTKEERGNKGAALTTFLSLPGRYMVLMPGDNTRGMSRKIPDGAERKQLKESIQKFELPEEMGYIIRTAAIGQSAEELTRDLQYLLRVYNNIMELSRKVKGPALIYRESNLMIRSIRDYFTQDMDEVLVDDPAVLKEAQDFFQQVMPEYARLVKLHQERRPIFSKYQIEEQIETIAQKQVFLPSGGSIVIDTTEALVAIDVNSGKMAGEQGVEGTAYKTNLEAASEVARQLRLRDLGGLVVIDFIDMRDRKHIREVEKRLKDALKPDKARVTVGRISQFGLLEMSRQRIKAALAEASYLSCPNCQGTGRVRSVEAQAVAFLRKLHATVARGQLEKIEGEVPLAVSHYLLNNKREELVDLERRYQSRISIHGRKSFVADQTELIVTKREKDEKKPLDANAPVTAATTRTESHEEPETTPANGTITEDKPQKKSRSRRRGKKTATADPGAESSGTPAAAQDAVVSEIPAEPVAESAASDAAAGAEPAEKRPSRRRRGRRAKKPDMANAGGAENKGAESEVQPAPSNEASAPAAPVETEQPAPLEAPSSTQESAAPRKRRTRRTRKPAAAGSAKTESAASAGKDATTTAAAEPALVESSVPDTPITTDEAEAATPPRKRRNRRPKKPAVIADDTPQEVSAQVAVEKSAAEPRPSAEAPAPEAAPAAPSAAKPRRPRRTRKPAAETPADDRPETSAPTPSTEKTTPVPASAVAATQQKPAGPKRRKPQAGTTSEAPAAATIDPSPAATKPKRAPASRRKKPAAKVDPATPESTD